MISSWIRAIYVSCLKRQRKLKQDGAFIWLCEDSCVEFLGDGRVIAREIAIITYEMREIIYENGVSVLETIWFRDGTKQLEERRNKGGEWERTYEHEDCYY